MSLSVALCTTVAYIAYKVGQLDSDDEDDDCAQGAYGSDKEALSLGKRQDADIDLEKAEIDFT